MELFFLLKREYPPYYKWTYQALRKLDEQGGFSEKIQELADTKCSREAWEGTAYHANRPNYKDRVVSLTEEIVSEIADMLISSGLTDVREFYLERYVS